MPRHEKHEDNAELHCEELQDIIGRMPSSIERYGISVLICIVFLFLLGSYLFRYPSTLEAKIIITNSTPPVNVVAKTSGYIEYLNAKNKCLVRKGDILGVIGSTAQYKDVLKLEETISLWNTGFMTLSELVTWTEETSLQIGELQKSYSTFCNHIETLYNYRKQNYFPRKMILAQKLMDSRKIQEKKEHKQCILKLEQERINKETFTRDSILYSKNILSEEDYGKARLMYSQSLQGPIERELEECQHQMQQISDKASILDLENQHFRTTQQYEQAVFSAFLDLMGIIKQWEQTYIMRSPIDGILNLVDVWGQGQYIKDGNVSFVIMPINLKTPIGKASLPAIRAGEIEIGQRVIISVNNFPEEDYGNLMGKVSAISSIPTADGVYMIDIAFPNGLKTVFNKNLPPAQQLLGSAKIIMEDRRLCDWFVLPLKNLLKSQKILSEENLN